eukprot:tig00000383_g24726.t1
MHRSRVVALYKSLIGRAAAHAQREYALRTVREEFRKHATVADVQKLSELIREGENKLRFLRAVTPMSLRDRYRSAEEEEAAARGEASSTFVYRDGKFVPGNGDAAVGGHLMVRDGAGAASRPVAMQTRSSSGHVHGAGCGCGKPKAAASKS